MRILLTGATGFIGRALSAELLREGFTIRAIARLPSSNLCDRLEWRIVPNLAGAVQWNSLLSDVDVVVHLAALAHQVGRSGENRLAEFMQVNGEIPRRLSRAVRESSVRKLIYLSSVAVFGDGARGPIDEQTPARPTTDYGRSKLEGEVAVESQLAGTGKIWLAFRSPLVFGPGNPGNMARLLELIRRRVPLPFGSIQNARSFLYVENLVDAIATSIRSDLIPSGVYVVDDGTVFSTPELCRALGEASGVKLRIFRVSVPVLRLLARAGDVAESMLGRQMPVNSYSVDRLVRSLVVDGKKFRRAAAWVPPVSADAAIRRIVESIQ